METEVNKYVDGVVTYESTAAILEKAVLQSEMLLLNRASPKHVAAVAVTYTGCSAEGMRQWCTL